MKTVFIDKSKFVNEITNAESTNYLVHNYHPFAAKFVPQIPRYLIPLFTKKYELVCDPFCGSGTSLVEAMLLNRHGIGIELNPIGAIVSKVKTTPLSVKQLNIINSFLEEIEVKKKFTCNGVHGDLLNKRDNIKYENIEDLTASLQFPNKYHWFKKDVLNAVLYIKKYIDVVDDLDVRDFLLVALSSIIVKVSNQESETRYAAIDKNVKASDVFSLFNSKVRDMFKRMIEFIKYIDKKVEVKIYNTDTRRVDFIPENSVDFIITSPPYPNTYDYYLYHKLRMIILGFDYKPIQKAEIGSRHKHSSKNENIDSYLNDMKHCLNIFSHMLKPGKYLIIVIGDAFIKGEKYSGYELIQDISSSTYFKIVEHIYYDLDMISKFFNKSFRKKGKKEHIIILQNAKE